MSTTALKNLAELLAAKYPDRYTDVTGRLVWQDRVGREYALAEAKWLRHVAKLRCSSCHTTAAAAPHHVRHVVETGKCVV